MWKVYDEVFHALYFPPNISRVIKWRSKGWAVHLAITYKRHMRNPTQTVVENLNGRDHYAALSLDNNEMGLRDTECEEAHWTQMAVGGAVVGFCEQLMNFRCIQKERMSLPKGHLAIHHGELNILLATLIETKLIVRPKIFISLSYPYSLLFYGYWDRTFRH